jgi:hypothetical protein
MTVRALRPAVWLLPALFGLVLSGCRIDVGTEVAFDSAGGGEVAVSVRIDGATLRELDRTGTDPELDVALGLGTTSSWRGERTVDADGGLTLTYRQSFTDGASATALLRELSEDVAAQDPAVRLDVTVVTGADGSVRLHGTGAITPPSTLGVSLDDEPVGPSGDELAALTADAVRATLAVRVPGRIVEHDADLVDGETLRWTLPVGAPRPLTLTADAAPLWRRLPGQLVIGTVVLLAAGGTIVRIRQRARARTSGQGQAGPGGVTGGQPSGVRCTMTLSLRQRSSAS